MTVIFFEVDGILNFPDSDAVAPSGAKGVAESSLKNFKAFVNESGSKIVLTGSWKKNWDFVDEMCTKDGVYLNKKLNRHGLHILDKTKDLPEDEAIKDWLKRHPNVTNWCVLAPNKELRWNNQ